MNYCHLPYVPKGAPTITPTPQYPNTPFFIKIETAEKKIPLLYFLKLYKIRLHAYTT
jgi:hypothetical protein